MFLAYFDPKPLLMKQIGLFILVFGIVSFSSAQKLTTASLDAHCTTILDRVAIDGDTTKAMTALKTIEKRVVAEGSQPVLLAIIKLFKSGVYVDYLSKIPETLHYILEAMPVFEKAKEWGYAGSLKARIASIYQSQSDSDNTQRYLEKARKDLEKCNDESFWTGYYINLGTLNTQLRDSTEAKKNYFKAIALADKYQQWHKKAGCYYNLGFLQMRYDKANNAMPWFEKALAIQKQYGYNYGLTLNQIIRIHIDYNKDFKKGEPLIDELIVQQNKNGGGNSAGKGYLWRGEMELVNKNYVKAKIAYETALKITEASGLDHLKLKGYEGMATYYSESGDYKLGFEYLVKAYYLAAKVLQNNSSEKAQQKQALYNLSEKNKEIENLEKEKTQQNWLLALSILVAIVGLGALYQAAQKNKIKTQLMLEEKATLQEKIDFHQRELLSSVLYLDQRNEFLSDLKERIKNGESPEKLTKEIEQNMNFENDWEKFKLHFEQVHPDFFKKLLKLEPNLTDLDKKHCAYIQLNLSPKQVANLLGISNHSVSVARTRLKNKLNIPDEVKLTDFLTSI